MCLWVFSLVIKCSFFWVGGCCNSACVADAGELRITLTVKTDKKKRIRKKTPGRNETSSSASLQFNDSSHRHSWPPAYHPRIKRDSNLDSKLQLKGSPCNFPSESLSRASSWSFICIWNLILCRCAPPWPHLSWLTSEPRLLQRTLTIMHPHFLFLCLSVSLPSTPPKKKKKKKNPPFIYLCYPGYTVGVPPHHLLTLRLDTGSHLIVFAASVNN